MKACASCHKDLPKESYSKKQWKLDKYQRRCKVCTTNNREVRLPIPKHDNNNSITNDVVNSLDSMCLEDVDMISDEELFKEPPSQHGDCPICFVRIPSLETGRRYKTCCGKMICSGCSYAPVYDNKGNVVVEKVCAFCRTLLPKTQAEATERKKKRVGAGDAQATYNLGCNYRIGKNGMPQDHTKALELFHRAADFGCDEAYCNIGCAYDNGEGVEVDKEKAKHYYGLAAMGGDEIARHNLGVREENEGSVERALKHYMIATRDGYADSLKQIQNLYTNGNATKEDYAKALQSYQTYLGEIKSPQRDKAAATHNNCRYY